MEPVKNMYNKINTEDIFNFNSILGIEYVSQEPDHLTACATDQTEDLMFLPEVVLQPGTANQIAEILSYCNQRMLPVTPRGAGTGLSGGALPVFGGVVIDMKRFNRILEIDKRNFQVTTQPGVITQILQSEVAKEGLFYPPDPASKGSCFIGGNVSENSGGPRAVKYGVVKDYVLNLEVVLPTGEIISTGANVLKNATGYNLTQLMVGSEGTLGIITKLVLKLIPAVKYNITLLVPFFSAVEACQAVNDILLEGIVPSALEFMERDAVAWAMHYTDQKAIDLPDGIGAHLLIEVDGNEMDSLYRQAEEITDVLKNYRTGEVLLADNNHQKEMLWALRRKVGEAVKSNSIYKEEDTVVPRAKLPELLQFIKSLGADYGFQSVCYGHAGDGNLHVNIIKGAMSDHDWNHKLKEALKILFRKVVELGGTISGEHGIGLVQKEFMEIAFKAKEIEIMRQIKNIFDPNGILNPGKIF